MREAQAIVTIQQDDETIWLRVPNGALNLDALHGIARERFAEWAKQALAATPPAPSASCHSCATPVEIGAKVAIYHEECDPGPCGQLTASGDALLDYREPLAALAEAVVTWWASVAGPNGPSLPLTESEAKMVRLARAAREGG